jgi:hypothetical protein
VHVYEITTTTNASKIYIYNFGPLVGVISYTTVHGHGTY